MTPTETVKLVALIAQLWPSMKLNEYTADAWHLALADLPYPVAAEAVVTLAKTTTGYIMAADIRRQAAEAAGLLPPSEAAALQMALDAAATSTARGLPEPVQGAYWEMGGSSAFEAPAGVLRQQWGRVYREWREALEKRLLGGDLGAAIESARWSAIEGSVDSPPPAIAGASQRPDRGD